MDLRLLEYFAVAAELEHIGKAAQRLHISQSPLSRQIRQLEAQLGLELFVRERQRIRLTESGRWLLNQTQGLLAHVDKIRREADQRAQGKTGTLAIAFVSGAMWSGILPELLRSFQAAFPNATLDLRNMRSTLQIEAVESGRLDFGFVSTPARSSSLETTCVSEEPYLLVVPSGHVFSRKRHITPRHLDGARWILLASSLAHSKHDRFLAYCAQAGFIPQIVQTVTEPSTFLALVESGFGVGLIQGSARHYAPRSLTFHALPWLAFKSRIYMIRPASGRQPLADTFASYIPQLRTTVP